MHTRSLRSRHFHHMVEMSGVSHGQAQECGVPRELGWSLFMCVDPYPDWVMSPFPHQTASLGCQASQAEAHSQTRFQKAYFVIGFGCPCECLLYGCRYGRVYRLLCPAWGRCAPAECKESTCHSLSCARAVQLCPCRSLHSLLLSWCRCVQRSVSLRFTLRIWEPSALLHQNFSINRTTRSVPSS